MHLSLSLSRYSSPENMPLRSLTIESVTDQGPQLLGTGIHHLNMLGPHLPTGLLPDNDCAWQGSC